MSFRGGRGGAGGRGGGRGGFSRGGGRGGRGGFGGVRDDGPPERVVEIGLKLHDCEGDMVLKSSNEMIPYFNAPVYLENKTQIGKVDEIFGAIKDVHFSVKMSEGMVASSFNANQKFFINPEKLLPLARFLPKPPAPKGVAKRGGGAGARGARGGGRGGARGGGRGGFTPRGGGRGGRGGSFGGGRGRGAPRGGGGFRGGH